MKRQKGLYFYVRDLFGQVGVGTAKLENGVVRVSNWLKFGTLELGEDGRYN